MKRENVKQAVLGLFADGRQRIQTRDVAEMLGVTRQAAHLHLSRLTDAGVLEARGAGRGAHYVRADRIYRCEYALAGLAEHQVWEDCRAAAPVLADLPAETEAIVQYALTELVNNSIDHSSGSTVTVEAGADGSGIYILVVDDGVGVYSHLRRELNLPSEIDALQELSKGKVTTQPSRHTGEGLFFVPRIADQFQLHSGELEWRVDNDRGDMAVANAASIEGTRAYFEIDRDTSKKLMRLFDEFTEDFEFTKTQIVIKLFEFGTRFISRSEAKRLLHDLDRFRQVVLDFNGVDAVGQGFADEVFRIWAASHPEVILIPINMNEAVRFLVERARRG